MKPTPCGVHKSDMNTYSYCMQLEDWCRCTCDPLSAFWCCSCVGSLRYNGPVTEHVATELRVQRYRLQLSHDDLAERTGLSKVQELRQQRLQADVMPTIDQATDDRQGSDDSWELR